MHAIKLSSGMLSHQPPPLPPLLSLYFKGWHTAKADSNSPTVQPGGFQRKLLLPSVCRIQSWSQKYRRKKRERVPKERPSNKLMGPGSFLSWAPVLCYLLGYWLQSPWIQLRFSCFEFLSEIKSMRFITQCSPSSSDLLPMIQVPLTNYTPGKNLFGLFFFFLHISTYSASSGRWRKRPHEALCKLYLSTVH